jgi:hypothetical protein
MNGETGKIVRLGVLMGFTALAVAGCALPFSNAAVDPASPVADVTRQAADRRGVLPTFAAIPAGPVDVRSAERFKAAVTEEQAAGEALRRKAEAGLFTLSGTEAFAAKARAAAKAPDFGVPTDADRAETEAFAKAARGRATAPPSQPQ